MDQLPERGYVGGNSRSFIGLKQLGQCEQAKAKVCIRLLGLSFHFIQPIDQFLPVLFYLCQFEGVDLRAFFKLLFFRRGWHVFGFPSGPVFKGNNCLVLFYVFVTSQ